MSGQHTPIPMSSDKGEKYANLAARIRVGKASQEDAAKAILDLIGDNERLAVLLGERKAKAATVDDLLEALIKAEQCVEELCRDQDPANQCWVVLADVRAAIAKATGEAS